MKRTEFEWSCRALGEARKASLAIPEGEAPKGGWPMLTLLHGLGRDHRTVVDAQGFDAWMKGKSFALLCPDGGSGWYLDSPVDPAWRYSEMLTEAIDAARGAWQLSSERGLSGIAGWSMGGYGAIRLAERSPRSFSFAASIIGLLDFPKRGDELLPVGIPKAFGENPELWRKLSCMAEPEKLENMELLIVAGRRAWDFPMSRRFHKRLLDLGIECRYEEIDAGHEWRAVAEALPILFDSAERHFQTMKERALAF